MKCVCLFSGGQDSTTVLSQMIQRYGAAEVLALSVYYGQRHKLELQSASKIAAMSGVTHEVVQLPQGILASSSPLVSANEVGHYKAVEEMPGGVEPTFVPMRNLLFLVIAANRAIAYNANTIACGVSQEDYGGYPDCRAEFIDAAKRAINAAVGTDRIVLETPLLFLTKRDTVMLAHSLPGCWQLLAHSHTCYDGQFPPNPRNHASILRARGFKEAGMPDPLIERAIEQKLLPADYPPTGYVLDSHKFADYTPAGAQVAV